MNPSETAPALIEVINRIKAVLQGDATREEVSDWANFWVMADDPIVEDSVVWDLLVFAGGLDLKKSATDYLHSNADIQAQLKPFTGQTIPASSVV